MSRAYSMQAVQHAAIARFGVKAYVELVVVTSFYQMFSSINQGFAVSALKTK